MKKVTSNKERGIALFFSIFALLLLMAIASALIFMANTETSVNFNYRQEQIAYFGAKAGVEEARARMMPSDPASIFSFLPTAAPTTSNKGVIYITNPGSPASTVTPWNPAATASSFPDDELCHDGYGSAFGTVVAPDVRCDTSTLPAGTSWYASYTSNIPFYNTASPLPYKWVRIAPKLNGSVSYLTGAGSSVTTNANNVNPNANVTVKVAGVNVSVPISSTTPICWDGSEEVALTITPPIAKCSDMVNTSNAPLTNVYLVTSLGVSASGARKVVQADVALQPTPPFLYGLYATSTACPAITFTGQNPATDSYTTANGGTYATTQSSTGGDIGSNGGVSVQNGNVGGIVGVLQPPPAGNGTCANPVSINSPGGKMVGTVACPSGVPTACYLPAPYVFPAPPPPNPLPPNTASSLSTCTSTTVDKKGKIVTTTYSCLSPGTYGNLTVNGAVTLAPGVYNINSLAMQGNGQIIVSPPGAITFNVAGQGGGTVFKIDGNGITDDQIPNDLVINYAGSGTISIAGNADTFAMLDAPNAAVTQQGNGAWYGSLLANTASIGGNAFFHYDKNAGLSPANHGYFTLIGSREVPY